MTDEEAEEIVERLWRGAWLRIHTDRGYGAYSDFEMWRVRDMFRVRQQNVHDDINMPVGSAENDWDRDGAKSFLREMDYGAVKRALDGKKLE
jgi:hypothetical protein